jgi:hypothetical protein
VKIDLWLAAAVALDVIKLLREVNAGRNVIKFIDDFDDHLTVLKMRTTALLEEMKATERYQQAEAARLKSEAES